MENFVAFLPLVLLSALAVWQKNAVLFMLAGGVALMTGLWWYDVYTTDMGLAIGLALIGYWLVCWGYSFRLIFWTGGPEAKQ